MTIPPEWTRDDLIRQLELLDDTLALYATDEDRFLRSQGEPYGSIPTEAGMVARSARYRVQLREAREVHARDDLRGLGRAMDVNRRLCVAYLVMCGIYDQPLPDMSDVSLAEANAATVLVKRLNKEIAEEGGHTFTNVVASEEQRENTLAFALRNAVVRRYQLDTFVAVTAGEPLPEQPAGMGDILPEGPTDAS